MRSYLEDPEEFEHQSGPCLAGAEGLGCPSWQFPAAVLAPVTQLPVRRERGDCLEIYGAGPGKCILSARKQAQGEQSGINGILIPP